MSILTWVIWLLFAIGAMFVSFVNFAPEPAPFPLKRVGWALLFVAALLLLIYLIATRQAPL